ncbi:putative transcription factor B3-Domain family [Helianthus annuus]|nr:putative transcription factor B3-Domain family [Helianthus annuus]
MRRSRHNSALQDNWPIRKALTLSDVDITHPFLTLPRQPVETCILVHLTQSECEHLLNREQVPINAQDDDTGDVYIMKLKWRGSYYNLIGKWGRIVRSKGLDVGKVIKIRWFDGCLHFSVPQQDITVPPLQVIPAPAVHDQWPIRKVLTLSDVDTNHPFLPLARRSVEDHILVHWTPQQRELLRSEEQGNLNARDVDTGEIYVMKLRWRGNYYNLIGKWGKIIRSKGLGVGKEIKIRWANGCLHFSVPNEQVIEPATIPIIQQHRQQQQQQQQHQQQQHHHHNQQHQHQQQQHYQKQHDEWPIKKALTLEESIPTVPEARISVRPVWRKDLFGPISKTKPVETINHISDSVPKTFETSNEKPTSEESIPTVPEAPTPKMIPMDPIDPHFLPPNLGISNLDYTSPNPIHDPYYLLTIESLNSTFAKGPNMEDFDYPPKPSVSVPHTVNQGENFQK